MHFYRTPPGVPRGNEPQLPTIAQVHHPILVFTLSQFHFLHVPIPVPWGHFPKLAPFTQAGVSGSALREVAVELWLRQSSCE